VNDASYTVTPENENESPLAEDGFSRSALLQELFASVLSRYQPEVVSVVKGESSFRDLAPGLLSKALRAQGIWFQLLAIAEQNRDMRNRRLIETQEGAENVQGTFAQAFAMVGKAGVSAKEIQNALNHIRIRPTLTAHPTEAKRVTVLERYRRIYLKLFDLESSRWTPREREQAHHQITTEIELLWLTGELKLEKPTVDQEVAWGLYFFQENLFDVVPQVMARIEAEFARHFPEQKLEVPFFMGFGSWIGGDRDGNPYVTSAVTRRTLWETRLAVLRRYRDRITELIRLMSIAERTLSIPHDFADHVRLALSATVGGDALAMRNPGELFRQFLGLIRLKLEETLPSAERFELPSAGLGYRSADELLSDLARMNNALIEAGAESIAKALILPLQREVGIFRFSTVRLDIRENTIRMNKTLAEMYQIVQGVPAPAEDSTEWKAWLMSELTKPRNAHRDLSE
jgi:phosphoenolpyruvate carboxylase